MARIPRFDLPNIAQHIIQRGNNRLPCFLDDEDRLRYLHLLGETLRECACRLHAYVLMDNHVHLLATPPVKDAISVLMQRLGRNYVSAFNRRHARTGTLWEGRYKASLVDSENYLLRCHRYIELNSVRARLTDDPVSWRWSSCAVNLGQRSDSLVDPHATWLALGPSPEARAIAWRRHLDEAIPPDEVGEIRSYLQQQRALGHDAFREMVEAKTRRFAGVRPAHRPCKARPTSGK